MFEATEIFKATTSMGPRFSEDWIAWTAELRTFVDSSPEGPELGRRVLAMSQKSASSAIVFSA
jgi:hypothetical protein